MAEKVDKEMKKLSVSDDSKTYITVASWNILGDAKVEYRKEVTTKTFKHQFTDPVEDSKTSLGQADIICVQEMAFNPNPVSESHRYERDRVTAGEYLPFLDTHTIDGNQKEDQRSIYNGVFYKTEKFKLSSSDPIEQAFTLIEHKRDVYVIIKEGGDIRITKAIKGMLMPGEKCFKSWCDSGEKKRMCQEVLGECKAAGTLQEFHKRLNRFKGPQDSEILLPTQSPKALLRHRMGMCCLEVKSVPGCQIVAISVHNYSKGSGAKAPGRFAFLLFDFLKQLAVTCPVLIAGDFNLDIPKEQSLKPFRDSWIMSDYEMKAPRLGEARIDFVLVVGNPAVFQMISTKAHDIQVRPEIKQKLEEEKKYLTNHNPLSATVRMIDL